MFVKFTESSDVKGGHEQYYQQLCSPLCCFVLCSLPLHGPAINGRKSSQLSSVWQCYLAQFPTRNVEGMEMGNAPFPPSSLEAVAPHTKQNPRWGRDNIYMMSAGVCESQDKSGWGKGLFCVPNTCGAKALLMWNSESFTQTTNVTFTHTV